MATETITYATLSWTKDDGVREAGHTENVPADRADKLRKCGAIETEPREATAARPTVTNQEAADAILNAEGLELSDEMRALLTAFSQGQPPAPAKKTPAKKTPAKKAPAKKTDAPPAD